MDARRMSDATLLEELLATRKELSAANEELSSMRERAVQSAGQKERMATALEEAKEQITSLREEVDKAREGILFLMFMPGATGLFSNVAARSAEPNLYVHGVASELPNGRAMKAQ